MFSTQAGNVPSITATVKDIGKKVENDKKLNTQYLPGLAPLINDWYDEGVDVDYEQFIRRFLCVFRDSKDNGFSQVVEKYSQEQQEALHGFLDQTITAEDAAPKFTENVSNGIRRKLDSITKADQATSLLPDQVPDRVIKPPLERAMSHAPEQDETKGMEAKFAQIHQLRAEPLLIDSIQRKDFLIEDLRPKENHEFKNWGQNIQQTPELTFVPKSVDDVQRIIKYARATGKGVRVSGFRHSWSPLFGRATKKGEKNNGDVLISTLGEWNATVLPNFTSWDSVLVNWFAEPKAKELNMISEVSADFVKGPPLNNGKKYVRVGTSTTNEQLRRWCIKEGKVTLPLNIIEVEITLGGSVAPMCHGAGIHNKTLSDLIRCIEYIDANGAYRRIDMSTPEMLRAASGCFGLIGVVTHLVLEFDAMSCAVMRPVKLPVAEAVPPPPEMRDEDIPEPIRPKKRTPEEKRRAQEDFERRANTDFYAEWFWFPYSSEVWVNTWSTDPSLKHVNDYPSKTRTFFEIVGAISVNVLQNAETALDAANVLELRKTQLLSWAAMKSLDTVGKDQKPIRTWLPNALHFQRGVQNVRVRDLDIGGYLNIQRAWWRAILKCYQHTDTCPMRMPLEMRVMGASDVTMAAQRGNSLGTCAIEILTLHSAAQTGTWEPFAQEVLDEWMRDCSHDGDGQPLNVRPHWAKEWDGFSVRGRPWREILKEESYKAQIMEFKALLKRIGERDGWTMADIKRRFSNELLDDLFLDDVVV